VEHPRRGRNRIPNQAIGTADRASLIVLVDPLYAPRGMIVALGFEATLKLEKYRWQGKDGRRNDDQIPFHQRHES
jgi:hypothetical protein